MISMFPALAALAAQPGMVAQAVSPRPPVIVTMEAPTPPVIQAVPQVSRTVDAGPIRPYGTSSALPPLEPVTVWVRIFAGRRLLFSDQLRVARYNATAILQRSEAPGESCPPESGPIVQSTLTFQINRESSKSPDEFFMGLSWSHPVDDCKLAGSRGLSIAQPVTIKPGEPTVVTGDGGLRIELSRP